MSFIRLKRDIISSQLMLDHTLIHELAHSRHYHNGDNVSADLSRLIFGINKPNQAQRRSVSYKDSSNLFGFVSEYAKSGIIWKKPSSTPNLNDYGEVRSVSRDCLELRFIEEEGISLDLDILFNCFRERIPRFLKGFIHHIEVYPCEAEGFNFLAQFIGNRTWREDCEGKGEHWFLREDIAESVSYFIIAARHPEKFEQIIALLNKNKYTRGRMKILRGHGFISEDHENRLVELAGISKIY